MAIRAPDGAKKIHVTSGGEAFSIASETRISEKSLLSKQSNTFTFFVIIIHCCKVFKFAREKLFK